MGSIEKGWDIRFRDMGFRELIGENWESLLAIEPMRYEPQERHSLARQRHEVAKARQSNLVTAQALKTAASVSKPAIARLLLDHAATFESVGERG